MDSIRVHLGQMPPMLRAMINDLLAAEPDIAIVGNSYGGDDSLLDADADRADVLIAQEAAVSTGCMGVVVAGTPCAILTISESGHTGTGVKLVRDPVSLTGSGTALAGAVREIVARHSCRHGGSAAAGR
jgi:hypothetical protein